MGHRTLSEAKKSTGKARPSPEFFRKSGRRYVPAPDAWAGWPSDGVWLVEGGNGRRISRVGDVPEPMDLAALEVLRGAVEERAVVTASISTKQLLDNLFPVIAKAADERRLLESVERVMAVEREVEGRSADGVAAPQTPSSNGGPLTVVTSSDFIAGFSGFEPDEESEEAGTDAPGEPRREREAWWVEVAWVIAAVSVVVAAAIIISQINGR